MIVTVFCRDRHPLRLTEHELGDVGFFRLGHWTQEHTCQEIQAYLATCVDAAGKRRLKLPLRVPLRN